MKMNAMAKKIVLIDDDNTTNLLNKMIIDRSGLVDDVITFNKAQEALEYFTSSIDDGDDEFLVLLDVNMPVMNGWDFLTEYCPQVSAVSKRKDKVVMLTSSIDPSDKKKATEFACVNDFVSKPLSPDLILSLVTEYF